jgi:hypothetical protein
MLFSSRDSVIKKRIEPGTTEFMMHTRANNPMNSFERKVKTTFKEFRKRQAAQLD